jgi:formylglycine-generating enzyme required for sulfatase activity
MGSPEGESGLDPDESPQFQVTVEPFWMSTCEITNAQYAAFDPAHDSRFMDTYWKDRVGPGFALNGPRQPVVRVSCDSAEEFGHWLSISTGEQYRLPTEREWEYACRAGSAGPFSCQVTDLAAWANLADRSLGDLRPWALRDDALSDGAPVTADVGRYRPNAWGLFDMHGNVQEWCSSIYQAYPLTGPDVPADPSARGQRVVRGGSFDDRPRRARSAFRLSYPATQAIYNVGFRVVCPATSRREEAAGR